MPTPLLAGNYHSHTQLCRHAEGMPTDYAAEAVRRGLSILGISDHTPIPDDRWPGVRMPMASLPLYIDSVREAREAWPQLTILMALECEYIPEYHHFYEEELLGRLGMDYLVCAQHWFPCQGEWLGCFGQTNTPERLTAYTNHTIRAMQTELFAFTAHPDIFGNDYPVWDAHAEACAAAIAEAAAELNMPLEINALGFRREKIETPSGIRCMYPWPPFWETAARFPVTVTINSDAHRPADLTKNIPDALALAHRFNLPVVTPVKPK
ncbi:MAG: histidinol-phosphatase [Kiritimatiellae bacterium]|nr:histidinol-phosphatase [Kiritimatiellia bacterium]